MQQMSPTAATIKAVIFDWGGVLEALPDATAFTEWETRLGLAPASLQTILWGPLWEQVEQGAASIADYEAEVCRQCGFTSRAQLEAFYTSFYPQRLHDEMLAALHALRRRYRVALLTNAFQGQDQHIEHLTGMHPAQLVDHYVNSSDVGMRKPAPAIFQLTLQRLGVQPHEAVFIDDNPANIAAAQAAGLQVIPFETPGQALAVLEMLLGHPIQDAVE
jgi:epoxide hydrolase-like predicted phosphatase